MRSSGCSMAVVVVGAGVAGFVVAGFVVAGGMASAMGFAARGSAALKSSPTAAARVAATCAWVTRGVCLRSPRGGVSGPRTAIQIDSEPSGRGFASRVEDRRGRGRWR